MRKPRKAVDKNFAKTGQLAPTGASSTSQKNKKEKQQNNQKKQVPHPHQPLLLVEKGEKAIEKYLTESNSRNGKQITDHIILERDLIT